MLKYKRETNFFKVFSFVFSFISGGADATELCFEEDDLLVPKIPLPPERVDQIINFLLCFSSLLF